MDPAALAIIRAEFPNFRDLGGLPTSSSRMMRAGVVYRGQALTGISADAVAALGILGVRTLVDLRMPHERSEFAVDLPPEFAIVIADVMAGNTANGAAAAGSAASVPASDRSAGSRGMMMQTYRNFVQLPSAQAAYAALLRSVVQCEGATVVYCAAGKDRTGWASAVVQTFAGVDRSTAIAHYVESNVNLVGRYQQRIEDTRQARGDMEALLALIDANADYLAAAFEFMDARYGDIDGYLEEGLGLSSDERDVLRDRLLE